MAILSDGANDALSSKSIFDGLNHHVAGHLATYEAWPVQAACENGLGHRFGTRSRYAESFRAFRDRLAQGSEDDGNLEGLSNRLSLSTRRRRRRRTTVAPSLIERLRLTTFVYKPVVAAGRARVSVDRGDDRSILDRDDQRNIVQHEQ